MDLKSGEVMQGVPLKFLMMKEVGMEGNER